MTTSSSAVTGTTTRQRLPNRRLAEIITFQHEGRFYTATFGRFRSGRLAEIFLDTGKPNSEVQAHAMEASILVSLLLQHGVNPATIQHSISGPLSKALDLIVANSSAGPS